jgi:ABC-type antimicrobial peptide transport system permease subunit
VFGVTAFVVQTRRREIGIRLAIGASRTDVVMTMYRQGMGPVAIGVAVGLGLALVGSQVFSWALYAGTSPRDPFAFVGAAVVLLLATGAGVFIPARRAARVDPALSLRSE